MTASDETCDDSLREPRLPSRPEPGIVVVLAAGSATSVALPIGADGLEVGRATPPGLVGDDDRVSRRHVRIERTGSGWSVEDLGSRNGTFAGGRPVRGKECFPSPVLVRAGRSLMWAIEDIQPFAHGPAARKADGPIAGGRLRRAYGDIVLAARAGDTLFIRGESGSGKELAARAFHEARHGAAREAPFVAVNCAAIPEGLAERLLFGARKGSYSGATADADGYVQAAHGGTLFLDEIAELDPLVQAKLLRVLETREVLPLGASKPRQVAIAVCAASHKPLRDEVAAGRFREDLYFRVARPEVPLPALRERIDEVPLFVAEALRDADARLTPSVALVEACCLRPWPGNVRELLRELRRAAHAALHEGQVVVDVDHLSREAGLPLATPAAGDADDDRRRPPAAQGERRPGGGAWTDDEIRLALAHNAGNVRGTARSLGMHRNQLRRWLVKHPEAQAQPEPDGD